jgi:hypothetical protein
MVDALFCNTNDPNSYEVQADWGDAFVGPWVTKRFGESGGFVCPGRTLGDGNTQTKYDPSFLDGFTYEGKNGANSNYFGDDEVFQR